MSVDPVNGNFWFTGNFNPSSKWATRVGNFSIKSCVPECKTVKGLVISNITANSVKLNWDASGAGNYFVEYRLSRKGSWITAGNTPATSFIVYNLSPVSKYEFRVASVCGVNKLYSLAVDAITGANVCCSAPKDIQTISISPNAATALWTTGNCASSYELKYWPTSSPGSATMVNNITKQFYDITNLKQNTSYAYQVKAICAGAETPYCAIIIFNTINPPPCTEKYEPDNTSQTATSIKVNSTIFSTISSLNDSDWYQFNNTAAQKNIRVTLANLPLNYNIKLYNPSGVNVGTSYQGSSFDKRIMFNASVVGTYKVLVYNSSGSISPLCYTLTATINAAPWPLNRMSGSGPSR
jgi:Fibronectin type III domain/Bacterial pre-peptidase C-terminal domain